MSDKYYYDYEWDEKYCYPNSYVLKNKLNISDSSVLNNAEREITAMKILFLKKNIVKGNFDFKHLQKIHFAIFRIFMIGQDNFELWIFQKEMCSAVQCILNLMQTIFSDN